MCMVWGLYFGCIWFCVRFGIILGFLSGVGSGCCCVGFFVVIVFVSGGVMFMLIGVLLGFFRIVVFLFFSLVGFLSRVCRVGCMFMIIIIVIMISFSKVCRMDIKLWVI